MNGILAIAFGGGLGSVARHYASSAMISFLGGIFPYGTLLVNVLGSFVMGVLIETMAQKWPVTPETRAFLVTGFLGGFTTFSTFSLDVFKLAETGQAAMAAVYIALSVFVSIIAIFGGVWLMRGVLAG